MPLYCDRMKRGRAYWACSESLSMMHTPKMKIHYVESFFWKVPFKRLAIGVLAQVWKDKGGVGWLWGSYHCVQVTHTGCHPFHLQHAPSSPPDLPQSSNPIPLPLNLPISARLFFAIAMHGVFPIVWGSGPEAHGYTCFWISVYNAL